MAWINDSIIFELEQPISYRVYKRVEISSGKVGPADRLVEQSIPSEDESIADEADTARRVTRSMNNLNLGVPNRHRFSIIQKLVDLWRWRNRKSHELSDSTLHRLQHRKIFAMNNEGNLELSTDIVYPQHVVEVSVSGDDHGRFDIEVFEEEENSFRFITRVHYYCILI